jgi:hypothetical protein
MSRSPRTPGRADRARPAGRRGRHRVVRCYRDVIPALLGVVALSALTVTVAVSAVRPGPAAGDPTATARHAQPEITGLPMAAADRRQCITLLTAGLRTDLVAMDTGQPIQGISTDERIAGRWPVGSLARARVKDAYDALLLTAASDLFGRYARDVRAEVAGYVPRIAAACS